MPPRALEQNLDLSLQHLPGPFAKLAFLTAVRDPYTGRYLHEGWTSMGTPEEIHQILRGIHKGVFEFVSSLTMRELCAELERYFETLPVTPKQTAKLWGELEPYREMVPEGTCAAGREFFVSQMRAATAVLLISPDWVHKQEPAASPRQSPDLRFPRHLENSMIGAEPRMRDGVVE